jgi:hypothetical protein
MRNCADESRETSDSAEPETPQEIAACCLASGRTRKVAAATAQVSERQLYRWQHDPQFRRLIAHFRSRVIDQTLGILARHGTFAANKLGRLAREESPQVALNACSAILSRQIQLGQYAELSERLAAVENQLNENRR